MYDSLKSVCNAFHLYVFAFDDSAYHFLRGLQLEHLTVISLQQLEDEALLNVKKSRTETEYCWTCTPSTVLFCIETFNLPHCTYIDADLYFYSDPSVLIKEMGNRSVLITEHRFSENRDLSEKNGKYCVQFVTFKSDEEGMEVLQWWRNACLKWCYAYHEDGKFGDQKYLDDWSSRFKGIHELQHLGGGIAPWNVQQYKFSAIDGIVGTEINTGKQFKVVFYHFHSVKFFNDGIVRYTDSGYEISAQVKDCFYKPYIEKLLKKSAVIQKIDVSLNANGAGGNAPVKPLNALLLLRFYWYEIKLSPLRIFLPHIRKRVSRHHFHYI